MDEPKETPEVFTCDAPRTHTHTRWGCWKPVRPESAYRKLTANRIKRLQAEPETGECCS